MENHAGCGCEGSGNHCPAPLERLDQQNIFFAKSKAAEVCLAFTSAIDHAVRLEKGLGNRAPRSAEERHSQHLAYLEQLLNRGYNPSEPRDWHGRWTTDGSATNSQEQPQQQTFASNDRHSLCVERCMHLLELRRLEPGSDRNYWDYQKCYGACMRESS
jgi:hypothetical protein